MCDYSLHNVKSRPAKVGDELTTYQFYSGDPPPLKWSDLRYVFDSREDHDGKEALQG